MVPSRVAGVAVGERDLNWERNPLAEGQPQGSEPKTREVQADSMWAFVLSGPCHLRHIVPSRVAGVAVGGRDLNWERNLLAEGRPRV